MTTTHACLPCAFTRHALVQAFYREKETEDHGKNWIDSTPKHLRVADPKPGYLCFQPVWIRKKFRLLLKIWLERWEEKEQKGEGRKEKKGGKLVEWEGWEKIMRWCKRKEALLRPVTEMHVDSITCWKNQPITRSKHDRGLHSNPTPESELRCHFWPFASTMNANFGLIIWQPWLRWTL